MKKLALLFSLVLMISISYAQHTISMTLVTDRYASETTYELVNTLTDEVLASGGPWSDLSATGTTVRTIAPVDVDGTGCYAFYIYDAYGDGICCSYGSGYFEVYYDAVLVGEGGSFGAVGSVVGMGEGCPQNEIELVDITMPDYSITGQNYSVTGTVLSNGVATTSFDVTYKIDDGEFVTEYTHTCNISMGGTTNFTHNIPVTFDTDGTYVITVTVSNPNGFADDESDNTLTHTIISNTGHTPRKVLLEQFSTGQCPNCPAATTNITSWLSTRPDVIWITHHAGYYTDPMTVSENTELLVFFNDGGATYAPACQLDRKFLSPDGDPGPIFFPGNYTPGLIDSRIETPAFVTVEMEGIYNPDTRELDLTVSGEFVGNVADQDLRLSVYIIEDGIVGTQSGVTGSYTHNHVMRDAISATFGDAGVIANGNVGTTYTKTYTYTHNAAWVPENISIVAFVNNWDASDVNNRAILNAAKMHINDFISSTNDVNADNVMVFPNPANDVLNINFAEGANIQIVNNLGQIVLNIDNAKESNKLDVSAFEAGSYFVKITKDNVVTNHKVILVK